MDFMEKCLFLKNAVTYLGTALRDYFNLDFPGQPFRNWPDMLRQKLGVADNNKTFYYKEIITKSRYNYVCWRPGGEVRYMCFACDSYQKGCYVDATLPEGCNTFKFEVKHLDRSCKTVVTVLVRDDDWNDKLVYSVAYNNNYNYWDDWPSVTTDTFYLRCEGKRYKFIVLVDDLYNTWCYSPWRGNYYAYNVDGSREPNRLQITIESKLAYNSVALTPGTRSILPEVYYSD